MPTFLRRILPTVPGLLLAAVALCQIWLARDEHLSPWKGGGFGMFSTTDVEANRYIRLYVRRGASAFPVEVPSHLEDRALRARLLPTERRLREIALGVAAEMEVDAEPISGVRVEVWRRSFERVSLEPQRVILRQLEVELPDADG